MKCFRLVVRLLFLCFAFLAHSLCCIQPTGSHCYIVRPRYNSNRGRRHKQSAAPEMRKVGKKGAKRNVHTSCRNTMQLWPNNSRQRVHATTCMLFGHQITILLCPLGGKSRQLSCCDIDAAEVKAQEHRSCTMVAAAAGAATSHTFKRFCALYSAHAHTPIPAYARC